METFQFEFAAGPWWLYAVLVVVALIAAIVTYRGVEPDPGTPLRGVLIGLRTLGIAALLLMLFEPLLRLTTSVTTTPHVAIAVDVSTSNGMRDRSGERAPVARKALRELQEKLQDRLRDRDYTDADVVVFDDVVRDTTIDASTVEFKGFRTDLGNVVRGMANRGETRDYGAVVLITDGNATSGDNPIFDAERSGIGFHSIGIGDSIPPRDVAVQSLLATSVADVGKATSVSSDVILGGTDPQEVELVLEDNGVEITRQKVMARPGIPATVSFVWTPRQDGVRKLVVRAVQTAGEFTLANNAAAEFVRVRKDKRTVVLVAGAPSPDVTFVRSVLEQDPTITVKTFIQKQGSTFYEGEPSPQLLRDAQACFLLGYPTATSSRNVTQVLASAWKDGLSMFFIASRDVTYDKLFDLADVVPFRVVSSRPQEFQITADVSPTSVSNPLLQLGSPNDAAQWNSLPPIYRTETFVQATPGSSVLATIRVGNAPLEEPLLLSNDRGPARSAALLGYGLYRWKLLSEGPQRTRGDADVTSFFDTFIGNAVRWTSVRDDERRIRIRPTRSMYASGENVVLTASILDASLQPVENADVRVRIAGPERRDVVLAPLGNGRYSTVVGPLPAGDYVFDGVAKHAESGSEIGREDGRFSVGDVSLEDASLTLNTAFLRSLADRTGARFVTPEKIDKLVDAIAADPRMKSVAKTYDRELVLRHLPWLLLCAITAFAVEWTVRKRRGLV